MKTINLVGYASGIGAGNHGCGDGPEYLKKSIYLAQLAQQFGLTLHWHMLEPQMVLQEKYAVIAEISQRLAATTAELVAAKKTFSVIAGDHSCGVGTWSGVAKALRTQGDMGLIWIDAHLDANTDLTTPSGNIHGMPVAALLGHGRESLTKIADGFPKIKAENLCFIGIRSFESGEQALLEKLGVRIYYIEEVLQRGFATVFTEALAQVTQNTVAYGISFDLDALDPQFTPGTGTPEPNGLHLQDVLAGLKLVHEDPKFLGLEIAEFNPHECFDERTVKVMCNLLQAAYIGK